jgi:hypothetical protein
VTDALRDVLLAAAGFACGMSVVGSAVYAAAFLRRRVRFDLALSLTLVGVAGLALYGLLSTLERLGQPHLTWRLPLVLLSSLALVFGLLGAFHESAGDVGA